MVVEPLNKLSGFDLNSTPSEGLFPYTALAMEIYIDS